MFPYFENSATTFLIKKIVLSTVRRSKCKKNLTVDLPNFEHVPYFEHHVHVNKGFSKPTTYKLINLVHKDVFRLVNEIKKSQS